MAEAVIFEREDGTVFRELLMGTEELVDGDASGTGEAVADFEIRE